MARRRRKKIPEGIFTTTVSGLSHEGRGVARIDDKATFIFNALTGEDVEFEYTNSSRRFDEGRTTNILKQSTDRIAAKCEYFTLCGGCSLQHMTNAAQLKLKQSTLLEQLEHFGHSQPNEILEPITGPLYGYRHKARLGVRYVTKKESVLVGFREMKNSYLTNMDHCEVLHPSVGFLIKPLRETIQKMAAYNQIAQIEVAIGDDQTALIFRALVDLIPDDITILENFAKEHSIWLFIQANKPHPLEKLWPKDEVVYLSYNHPAYDITLKFHPYDFTQVNPAINQKMVARAIELLELKPDDTVLDLFCGLGNFTLPISRHCKHVTGIEGSNDMVARGKMNAKLNKQTNIDFYCSDLTKNESAPWREQSYNKLLIDPARSGALEIIPQLATWQPERIVYISCNPATLARDSEEIIKSGYVLEKAGIIDMFPHTNHVESIALFIQNKKHIKIKSD